MMLFKACPMCEGDLEVNSNDLKDIEVYCLQCGHRGFRRALANHVYKSQEAVPAIH